MLHAAQEEDPKHTLKIPINKCKVKPVKRNDRVRRRTQNNINFMQKLNKLSFQPAKKILPVAADTGPIPPPSRESETDPVETDDINELFYRDRRYVRSLRFKSLRPKINTVWLWGRRVDQVKMRERTIDFN